MKKFLDNILEDRQTQRIYLATAGVLLVSLLYAALNFTSLPPFVPIFNQLPWGDARITDKLGIFIPVAVATIIFIFNLVSSSYIYKKNPLIGRLFAVTSFLIALMCFLFIIRTIQIVL